MLCISIDISFETELDIFFLEMKSLVKEKVLGFSNYLIYNDLSIIPDNQLRKISDFPLLP